MEVRMRYRGINYRTPLEAKWAAFFYHLGWGATYDPFGYGSPTFVLDGGYYVVVTDAVTPEDYQCDALDNMRDDDLEVIVVGVTPMPRLGEDGYKRYAAGLLTNKEQYVLYWGEHDGQLVFDGGGRGLFQDVQRLTTAWAKATNDITGIQNQKQGSNK
jgi:hypothetical protein